MSAGTLETLRGLDRPVDLWIVIGRGDPSESSLRDLVLAYTAATPRLDVHWIDPDRDVAQLVDLQQRYGLEADRTEDGRVATDAVVIAASGDRHWFLTHGDLFEESDDVHVRPREERALTKAIRSVLGADKTKLCFTVGHGELSLDAAREERDSLGAVRDLLEKDNYELATVDTTAADAREPFAGCAVAVLAGPRTAFSSEEASRLRAWLLEGGTLLAAIGPSDAGEGSVGAPTGLDEALASFGIGLDDVVVHEGDAAVAIPDTHGEGILPDREAAPGDGEPRERRGRAPAARRDLLRPIAPPRVPAGGGGRVGPPRHDRGRLRQGKPRGRRGVAGRPAARSGGPARSVRRGHGRGADAGCRAGARTARRGPGQPLRARGGQLAPAPVAPR